MRKKRRFPHHKQVEWQPAENEHSNDSKHHLNHLERGEKKLFKADFLRAIMGKKKKIH